MKTTEIRTLLEKYFEGESTLQEEQALLEYFSGDVVDAEFRHERQHFLLLQDGRTVQDVNPDFESKLVNLIASQQSPSKAGRMRWIPRLAAAAAIALLIGIGGIMVVNKGLHRDKDTYTDPQLAYAEAQKTLLYVSQKMNQGIKPLNAVSKINAGNKSLQSLKKMDHSLDMLNRVSIFNQSSNLKK
jgi:hypothetical protein